MNDVEKLDLKIKWGYTSINPEDRRSIYRSCARYLLPLKTEWDNDSSKLYLYRGNDLFQFGLVWDVKCDLNYAQSSTVIKLSDKDLYPMAYRFMFNPKSDREVIIGQLLRPIIFISLGLVDEPVPTINQSGWVYKEHSKKGYKPYWLRYYKIPEPEVCSVVTPYRKMLIKNSFSLEEIEEEVEDELCGEPAEY